MYDPHKDSFYTDELLHRAHSVLLRIEQLEKEVPAVRSKIALNPELRGIYHRVGTDGSLTFELVESDGVVQFEVRPAQKHCNQRTYRWCERVLDTIDPPRRFKVI
jgi:hypothetical protein